MKLSPFSKFIIGFSVILIILFASLSLCLNSSNKVYENFVTIDHTNKVIEKLKDVQLYLSQAESNKRAYVHNNANERFGGEFRTSEALMWKSVDELANLVEYDPIQKINVSDFESLLKDRMEQLHNSNPYILTLTSKERAIRNKKLIDLNDKIVAQINIIGTKEKSYLKAKQETAYHYLSVSTYTIIFAVISSIVISFIIFYLLNNYCERKKEEEKELRALNENKNKFFSIISHDLRGSVGGIEALSKLLVENPDRFEQTQSVYKILHSTSIKAKLLLENLLTWARTQMNKIEFHQEQINISRLIFKNVDISNPIALNKGIIFKTRVERDYFVMADKNMINTVLRNLIHNAIKFSNQGGIIEVFADIRNSEVIISIKDNGIGMVEETRSKLFMMDQRAYCKGTLNEEGTGIGLLICKEFIEKNNGKIWVESEEGIGSVFYFSLKLIQNEEISVIKEPAESLVLQ